MAARKTLLGVARGGNRRETLEALRDRLASAIDKGPEPRDLAALSRRLEVVLAELDGLRVPGRKETVADALAARRKAKEAAAG